MSEKNNLPQLLVTVEQACRILQMSKSSIYRLVKRGELEMIKCGRSTRLLYEDILRYLENAQRVVVRMD